MSHANFLYIDQSNNGKGIFSKKDIAPQEIIFEIEGKLMTPEEIESDGLHASRSANAYRCSKDFYISPEGSMADYLNHSCVPNAYISKIGQRLFAVAAEKIIAGSEIVMDYSTIMAADDMWSMECNCGSSDCRGAVKRFIDLPVKIQAEYKDKALVPGYILEI